VFKVIDLPAEGKPQQSNDEARVAPPPAGTVRWIDVTEPDAEQLDLLRSRFDFHPLAIGDCATYGLQSKVDDFDSYLFIVLHTFTADPKDPRGIQIHEIHAFLSDTYLVTVHDNPVPAQELVWQRVAADRTALARGPSWVLYLTANAMVDATFPLLDVLTGTLDEIEQSVLAGDRRVDLREVFRLKRRLVDMRRVIRPLRDAIGILHRRVDERINERAALHLRDVYDHVIRSAEAVEEAREVATNIINAYQTVISNHGNDLIKRLTIFSAVFLPLSFIVGFFGQNFVDLPYDNDAVLAGMLISMVLVPAGLLWWFKKYWF
jgi:magnesium transporter